MKSDTEIREDVISELRWDLQISEPMAIGLAVADGEVTLTGHVWSYAEKLAAAQATERVNGVEAIANDLKIRLSSTPRDDSDITEAIAHVLEWNVQVPGRQVHARVEGGWVTLDGEVDYDFRRREVEQMARQVCGVTGVTDRIVVKPSASPDSVQAMIGESQAVRRVDSQQLSDAGAG
jgi:osmotically-inducible protein OsmY